MKRLENSSIDGRNDAIGTCDSLSRQKNLPSVHLAKSSTLDKANRMAFKSARQHSGQGLSHSTLSKAATRVDWKVKSDLSDNKSLKEEGMSGPMIAAVEGGFHTQYLLFTRNDVASASAAAKSAFLLKVQSNCCWDSIRLRILEVISKQCPDNTVYPPVKQLHIDGFLVEILPKANRPEVLPPYVQKRMMSRSLHAICIRITVDHSVMSSPLCTSLATGLSAFTKLQLRFPSEKSSSSKNIKLSQSSVLHEGSVITSCSFGPFSSRPVNTVLSSLTTTETVMQPSPATAPRGSLETSRFQTAKPTYSVYPKPAILSSSSSLSSADNRAGIAKSNLTTAYVGDSELRVSNTTGHAGQSGTLVNSLVSELPASAASNMQSFLSHRSAGNSRSELHSSTSDVHSPAVMLPLTSPSSAFSSLLSADSSNSQKELNSLILPVGAPESVKLSKDVMHSCAVGSSQTLKTVTGSSSIAQNCEAPVGLYNDVIIVDEDDSVPADTSGCQLLLTDAGAAISSIQSSSVELSSAPSQISVSLSPSSDTMQIASVHDNSISLVQSVANIPILSQAAAHPVSEVSGSDQFAVPVSSVSSLSSNIGSSQASSSEQTVLMTTTALQAISSSPGCECSAFEVEHVTECQQNEEIECITNTTRPILTGLRLANEDSSVPLLVDTETTSAVIPQPIVNEAHADSFCGKELSKDAENYSVVVEKHADTSHQNDDLEYLSVTSSGAEELVNGATSGESEISLLPGELLQSTEQSTVNEHQQPCPAEVPAVSPLQANVVEVVPSDEVRSFCDESSCG